MNWQHRLAAFFNVHDDEIHLVSLCIALYFFLGIPYVLIDTSSYALFLSMFGSQALPYTYIGIAVGVSLLAFIYLKLADRLPIQQLLVVNMGVLIVVTALLWIAVTVSNAAWIAFLLPTWSFGLTNLGNIMLWSVAGRLFDIRQGKRLFGLIGSGRSLASSAIGFLIAPLVSVIGIKNLLLVAVLSLVAGMFILQRLLATDTFKRSLIAPTKLPNQSVASTVTAKAKPTVSILQNRYAVTIFGLTVLWVISYFFSMTIYLNRAGAQFPDPGQLASFLGLLSAVMGIGAAFATLFLTGKIIDRFGLRVSLFTAATLHLIIMAAFVLVGVTGGASVLLFGLAVASKLVDGTIMLTLDTASIRVLYQPIPTAERERTQAIADGIIEPVGIGISGLLLLFLTNVLGLGVVPQALLFLVVIVALIWVASRLLRAYPIALERAITRRRLGETQVNLLDNASLGVLQAGLSSPYPDAVIYSLGLLEQMGAASVPGLLRPLLDHPHPDVRSGALQTIQRLKLALLIPAIQQRIAAEPDAIVRGEAIQTLLSLGHGMSAEQVAMYLHDPQPPIRRGTLIGLLRSGNAEAALLASDYLTTLASSSLASDRALVAAILGELGTTQFSAPLLKLLQDADKDVRQAALQAAGKVKNPTLWPAMIQALDDRQTQAAAVLALVTTGEAVLPALRDAFAQPSITTTRQISLIRVCSRLGGQTATRLLLSQFPNVPLEGRTALLAALSAVGYRAEIAEPIYEHIKEETQQAAYWTAALLDVSGERTPGILKTALEQQFSQARDRMLSWLSFIHEPRAIFRVRDAFRFGTQNQRAYAQEVIDSLLPQHMKPYVLPVMTELDPQQRYEQLTSVFPQPTLALTARLRDLDTNQVTIWLRACVLYTVGSLRLDDCRDIATNAQADASPLIREMAAWCLACLTTDPSDDVVSMTTIDKVLILRTIDIFASIPDEILAEIASLLEEVTVDADKLIFNKDDQGDSMYLIVSGQVRIHDGANVLNDLSAREVFGEMAILDPRPRMATATTLAPTVMLKLDASNLSALIDERGEVAIGIIRVLVKRLRSRVNDLSHLHDQLDRTTGRFVVPRV